MHIINMVNFYKNLCDKLNGTEVCDNVFNICILSELTTILADKVKNVKKSCCFSHIHWWSLLILNLLNFDYLDKPVQKMINFKYWTIRWWSIFFDSFRTRKYWGTGNANPQMLFTGMKKLAQNSLEFWSLYNTFESKVHSMLAFFGYWKAPIKLRFTHFWLFLGSLQYSSK